MYTLQYWHEHALEWRGAGFRSEDREAVVRRMRGAAEQCDHCVRFRVHFDALAGLSDFEYELATTPV